MKNIDLKIRFSDELFEAILELNNLNEARRFFRDLMTESELKEFSKRWQAAQMLDQKVSYKHIDNRLSMSTATISRINKCLNEGMNGFKMMINRLQSRS